ncbi:MAG: 1-acyl-sn-glycerol-3-phosphate acyltransferase [Nitrospirae bacterium]|nr:1-acyl-sn-glycerol-3-phosphate acyltransferase [Nitrospirota bacterium]MBI3377230.1 1-acyl-sn-glycerol-3-phosphate acyltransferase [Nitrospirota bacterium]
MGRILLILMNIYFYVMFLIASAIVIPLLSLFVFFLSFFVSKRTVMKRFRRCISWYGMVMTSVTFPFIRIHYEDHSGEVSDGSYIFVCNHRAATDAFLMCVLPLEAVQVVNIWPFRIPVLGRFARMAEYLDIRNMMPEDFNEKAAALLDEGVSIIFFPEGTRSGNREIGPFHGAAFRLALRSKAMIVPLCISGSENIPPRGSLFLHPGTIRVRRLPAVLWEEYKDFSVFSLKNRVRETIDKELSLMECKA